MKTYDIKKLFEQYINTYHQDKIKFEPVIIEYDNTILRFGMKKHQGVLQVNISTLLKLNQ